MQSTLEYINQKTNGFVPEIGIILGSGLGELADEYCDFAVPYSEIPNFIKSNVVGHKGRLVFTQINNKNVVMISEEAYNNLMENVHVMGNKSNYDWLMESKAQLERGNVVTHDLIEANADE